MNFKDLTPKQQVEEVVCCIIFVATMVGLVFLPNLVPQ